MSAKEPFVYVGSGYVRYTRQGGLAATHWQLADDHTWLVYGSRLQPVKRATVAGPGTGLNVQLIPNDNCDVPDGSDTAVMIAFDTPYPVDDFGIDLEGGPLGGLDSINYSSSPGNDFLIGHRATGGLLPYVSTVYVGVGLRSKPYGMFSVTDPKTGVTHPARATADRRRKAPLIDIAMGGGLCAGTKGKDGATPIEISLIKHGGKDAGGGLEFLLADPGAAASGPAGTAGASNSSTGGGGIATTTLVTPIDASGLGFPFVSFADSSNFSTATPLSITIGGESFMGYPAGGAWNLTRSTNQGQAHSPGETVTAPDKSNDGAAAASGTSPDGCIPIRVFIAGGPVAPAGADELKKGTGGVSTAVTPTPGGEAGLSFWDDGGLGLSPSKTRSSLVFVDPLDKTNKGAFVLADERTIFKDRITGALTLDASSATGLDAWSGNLLARRGTKITPGPGPTAELVVTPEGDPACGPVPIIAADGTLTNPAPTSTTTSGGTTSTTTPLPNPIDPAQATYWYSQGQFDAAAGNPARTVGGTDPNVAFYESCYAAGFADDPQPPIPTSGAGSQAAGNTGDYTGPYGDPATDPAAVPACHAALVNPRNLTYGLTWVTAQGATRMSPVVHVTALRTPMRVQIHAEAVPDDRPDVTDSILWRSTEGGTTLKQVMDWPGGVGAIDFTDTNEDAALGPDLIPPKAYVETKLARTDKDPTIGKPRAGISNTAGWDKDSLACLLKHNGGIHFDNETGALYVTGAGGPAGGDEYVPGPAIEFSRAPAVSTPLTFETSTTGSLVPDVYTYYLAYHDAAGHVGSLSVAKSVNIEAPDHMIHVSVAHMVPPTWIPALTGTILYRSKGTLDPTPYQVPGWDPLGFDAQTLGDGVSNGGLGAAWTDPGANAIAVHPALVVAAPGADSVPVDPAAATPMYDVSSFSRQVGDDHRGGQVKIAAGKGISRRTSDAALVGTTIQSDVTGAALEGKVVFTSADGSVTITEDAAAKVLDFKAAGGGGTVALSVGRDLHSDHIAQNTRGPIQWSSVTIDHGGWVAAGTDNPSGGAFGSMIVVPSTRTYRMSFVIEPDVPFNSAGGIMIEFWINGVRTYFEDYERDDEVTGELPTCVWTGLWDFVAGDTIQFQLYNPTSNDVVVDAGSIDLNAV